MKAKLCSVLWLVLGALNQTSSYFAMYSKSIVAGNVANELHVAERKSIDWLSLENFPSLVLIFYPIGSVSLIVLFLWDKISLTDMKSLFMLRNLVPSYFPA